MLSSLTPIDWLGILGSLIISGGYLAVTFTWVRPEKPLFNLINLTGAIMILISLWYRPNAGAIIIEVLWVIIALAALTRWLLHRR